MASIIMYVYGIIMLIGGIMGYAKAHSLISLLSGGVSGIIVIIAARAYAKGASWGYTTGVVIIALLLLNFGGMYIKGSMAPNPNHSALMRAMGLGILSLLALVGVLAAGRGK